MDSGRADMREDVTGGATELPGVDSRAALAPVGFELSHFLWQSSQKIRRLPFLHAPTVLFECGNSPEHLAQVNRISGGDPARCVRELPPGRFILAITTTSRTTPTTTAIAV